MGLDGRGSLRSPGAPSRAPPGQSKLKQAASHRARCTATGLSACGRRPSAGAASRRAAAGGCPRAVGGRPPEQRPVGGCTRRAVYMRSKADCWSNVPPGCRRSRQRNAVELAALPVRVC
ncbi:unnamed protein product [Urochloa humidicola]